MDDHKIDTIQKDLLVKVVYETITDAIVGANKSGNIISWNKGAEAMFGYTGEEVWEKPLTLIMPDQFKDEHKKGITRVAAGGEMRLIGKGPVEIVGKKKDGTEFPVELSLSMITDENGNMVFTGILRDISLRKKTEQEFQKNLSELQEFRELTVGRELKMIELKKINDELKKENDTLKAQLNSQG